MAYDNDAVNSANLCVYGLCIRDDKERQPDQLLDEHSYIIPGISGRWYCANSKEPQLITSTWAHYHEIETVMTNIMRKNPYNVT